MGEDAVEQMGGSDSKEEPPKESPKEAEAAKQRAELMGSGTTDLRTNDGGLVEQEKSDIQLRTEKLRAKARSDMHSAVDNSIETLAMTHEQIEQTNNDNKRLHRINEKLTEAEKHLKELEKG